MPEPYWPKKKGKYRLSDAEKNTRYARAWCRYCKLERHFLISDLRKIFGNIEVDDVMDHNPWRCTGCRKSGTIDVRLDHPSAEKLQGLVIRKLVRIDYVRRPVWRDEKA